ncbi:unnamed protein product [Sphacelaria rigidula]
MRIITADEMGLVKVVRVESGECLAVSSGEQTRARAVQTLCRSSTNCSTEGSDQYSSKTDYRSFHITRTAGGVEKWEASHFTRDGIIGDGCSLNLRRAVDSPAGPVAMACLPATMPTTPGSGGGAARILTCSKEGQVQVICSPPDSTSSAGAANSKSFSIRGPISAAIALGTGAGGGTASLAAGGRENDLKIYDVASEECTWKAKNAPHDFLDLRQPVWISSLRSLVPEEGLRKIIAGTAHRQVRLYDTRAQKRPTQSVDADEHGITTMTVASGGREVVVADTAGLVRVLDLRQMRWGRRFAGPGGSIRGLALHPTLPCLACVGLDRMARVYDYKTAQQTHQVYLKQRLNAVLFDDEGYVNVVSNSDVKNIPRGSKNRGGDDGGDGGSGSEGDGWGSGEEYEMDEDSSSEEEEQEAGVENIKRAVINGSHGGAVPDQVRSGAEADDSSSDEDDGEGRREGQHLDKSRPLGNNGSSIATGNGTGDQRATEGGSNGKVGGGAGGSNSSSDEESEDEDGDSEDEYNGSETEAEGGHSIQEAGGSGGSHGQDDDGDDSDDDESESSSEEEEAAPPPKRRVALAVGSSSSRKRRR